MASVRTSGRHSFAVLGSEQFGDDLDAERVGRHARSDKRGLADINEVGGAGAGAECSCGLLVSNDWRSASIASTASSRPAAWATLNRSSIPLGTAPNIA